MGGCFSLTTAKFEEPEERFAPAGGDTRAPSGSPNGRVLSSEPAVGAEGGSVGPAAGASARAGAAGKGTGAAGAEDKPGFLVNRKMDEGGSQPPAENVKTQKEKARKMFIGHQNERTDAEAEAATDRHLMHRQKTTADVELITSALKGNLVCSSLNSDEVHALCDAMQFYEYKAGDTVCEQGQNGSHFFIIHSGTFDVLIGGKQVNQMRKGKAFGEIALIHNCARSATVRASEDGGIWGVGRTKFRAILKSLSSRNFTENRQFLESVKIFEMLTDAQKNMICNAFVVEIFPANATIVSQGDQGDRLFIVKDGSLRVSINGKEIRKLQKGDYFGERALLYDEPRSATVQSVEQSVCCSIGRELLSKVLGNLQHVLFRNMMIISMQSSPVFLQFAPEQMQKLIEATVVREYNPNYVIIDRETKLRGVRFLSVMDGEVEVEATADTVARPVKGKDDAGQRSSAITCPPGGRIILSRGQSFGEEYVLNPQEPFAHKVTARSKAKVALLTASAFALVLGTKDIDETLDFNLKRSVIKKVYIFRYLSEQQLDTLIKAFRNVRQKKGDFVVQQGEIGTRFFVIKSGEVQIQKDGRNIRTCGKNDYFGERALLYDEPRSATVMATTEVDLWVVDKVVFLQIVRGPMLEHLESRIKLQDTQVKLEELEVVRTVGRGTFGVVKLVRNKSTGVRYALKCVKRQTVIVLNQQEHIKLEREILAENDHPFIIKLVRTFKDRNFLYFLTELVTGGELYDAIRKLGLLGRAQSQFYLGGMILAVESLHERNIAYRDLKPENVLLDSQG
uniref:cGMP-dependent protein kinase n=1 Tax=Chromera velia CCMP2878 TaxID=1169474 RepID=A0A0G4IBD7_9ALVE|eukprot:Cvel_12719.t1-p1 / transcript=Cvel_12719.t1 / gene=Cvel_12719 / organism=Chromera_velia_CCMP2878 / gene_product=cAMP-dependent protein kinase regulatory subunit, putative / transcript_product=cAMP-dependent protein kinase regulatory subunit, putative / location=Cvel_scaffold844:17230-32173(+) / protein_length=792 / sequence_SO=supercontig / SO=protein_coding / is_pseudo=false